MPRSRQGTIVICVQNLDLSGANQVIYNIIVGRLYVSNIIILSPTIGPFSARFIGTRVGVRTGDVSMLLDEIRDIICIFCNTIMTAHNVVEIANRSIPNIWILHEWWDDALLMSNLSLRNMTNLNIATVKQAFACATLVVFMCEAQRNLYKPTAPSTVIYVGVPSCPNARAFLDMNKNTLVADVEKYPELMKVQRHSSTESFCFLCIGIVCPRKQQIWAVTLFKQFARDSDNFRLIIVGARRSRQYETEYLDNLIEAIGEDHRIELHNVTDDVDSFYKRADCLLFTSVNEVTPMVICEAMSWGLPVLATNIAGIPELVTDGVDGFLFGPNDTKGALQSMNRLVESPSLRMQMSRAARCKYETMFTVQRMIERYRDLLNRVAPPLILIDMDGTLVDWDAGFRKEWNDRCPIYRDRSYHMEKCVDAKFRNEAIDIFHTKGFFASLPPHQGGIEALLNMKQENFRVAICTSPILTSQYCLQEKYDWVKQHLGEIWCEKMIIATDKSAVRGDILIDDKPFTSIPAMHVVSSQHSWQHVVFDALYNRNEVCSRLHSWKNWKRIVWDALGREIDDVSDGRNFNLDNDHGLHVDYTRNKPVLKNQQGIFECVPSDEVSANIKDAADCPPIDNNENEDSVAPSESSPLVCPNDDIHSSSAIISNISPEVKDTMLPDQDLFSKVATKIRSKFNNWRVFHSTNHKG